MFNGHLPLDLIADGTQNGLMIVRRFLDAARGGLYMPPNVADVAFKPHEDCEIVFQ